MENATPVIRTNMQADNRWREYRVRNLSIVRKIDRDLNNILCIEKTSDIFL